MVNAREITHYNHSKLWKGVLAGSLVFSAFAITTGLLFPEILPKFYYNNRPEGSFTSHAAINILSNLNFDAAHGVNSGNGTSTNPYIIDNWEFSLSGTTTAVSISNTNKYVQLNYLNITSTGMGSGIKLSNATHVKINHVLMNGMDTGISIASTCSDIAVDNATISSSGTALAIGAMGVQAKRISATSSAGIGIDITGASVSINNSDVHHCGSIGLQSTASGTVVNNSRFFNNTGDAIYMTGSGNKIVKSNLTWNFAYGVRLRGSNGLVRNLLAKFTSLEHIFLEGSSASNNNISFNTLVNSTGQPCIQIQNAPDNLINNNTVTNLIGASSNPDGILITGATGLRNNVINNTFSVNQTGVTITSSAAQNKVQRNKFIHAATNVLIQSAGANDVLDNTITANHSVALQVITSTNVKLAGNKVLEAGETSVVLIDNQNSPFTTIENNELVGGATAVYIFGSTGVQVLRNQVSGFAACGVHAAPGTSAVNVSLNHLFQAPAGTGVWIETSGNTVIGNNITTLNIGITISNAVLNKTGNVIRSNFIELNTGTGLILDANTSRNTIYNNVFYNPAGFNVQCANATNVFFSVATGIKNILNGPNMGGNYWHNYTLSIDSNLDGFGDLPYTQSNVNDTRPLVVLPVVNSPNDVDYYAGLANCRIPWTISASRPVSSSYYRVLIDGALYVSGTWNSGTQLVININTALGAGIAYNYTIQYNYTATAGVQFGRQDSVLVYIRTASYQTFSVTAANQTSRLATFGLTLSVQGNRTMSLYVDRNNSTANLLYQIHSKPGNANGLNVRIVHNQLTDFKLNYSLSIEYTDAQLSGLGIDDARIDPFLWNDATQSWMDLRAIAKSYSVNRATNVIYIAMPDNTALVGEFIFIGTPQLSVSTNSSYYTSAQSVQISVTWANINNAALSIEIKNSGSMTLYSNTSWGTTNAAGSHVRTLKISTVAGMDNDNFSIYILANNGTHTKSNQYYLRYFVVDSILPVITIATPVNGTTFNSAPVFVANIFDVNFNSVSYRVNVLSSHTFSRNISTQIDVGDWNTLGNGTHTVQITANDLAGNVRVKAFTFIKDTGLTYMSVVSPSNNTHFNGAFSFRVDAFDTFFSNVTYQIDGLTVRLCARNSTVFVDAGDWTSLGQGNHMIKFIAMDTAGNSKTLSRTFIKDTVLPTVQITSPAPGAAVGAPFMINTRLIDTYPNASSMFYRIDSPANTSHSFSGNASIDVGVFTVLSEGAHVLYVYGRDLAGNTNYTTVSFTKDTVSPVVTILTPTSNRYFNTTFTVAGTNTDLHPSGMRYTVNTSLITGFMTNLGSNWSATIPGAQFNGLADGSYNLTVYANDTAGNTKLAWVLFTKDSVSPTLTVLSPGNSTYPNAAFQINVTVADTNYDKTWYRVDGGASTYFEGNTVITGFGSLSEGPHVLMIYASDKAGNVKASQINFVKDTGLPVIVINSPTTGSFRNQTFLIDVTSMDPNLEDQWYIVDDVLSTKTIFDGSELITSAIFNTLAESSHTVKVYANDSAGNQAFTSFTFTKDTVLPVLTRILPAANNGYYKLPFYYEITVVEKNIDDSYFRIDSLTGSSTSFAENATQSFTSFNDVLEGSHTVYFFARDFAGNTQNISLTFTKDITNPTMQLYSPANSTVYNTAFPFIVNIFDMNYANATYQVNALTIRSFTRNASTVLDANDWNTLGEGTHQIRFTANDLAGNSRIIYLSFVKDTTAPTLTLLLPGNGTYHAAAFMLSVRAEDPRYSSVWYRVDSGTYVYSYNGNQTIVGFSGLSEGQHNVQVFANDTLGNSRYIFVTFTKDTILPSISISSPANNTQFKVAVSFRAFVSDTNLNATTYRVDAGTSRSFTRNTTTTIDAGDWSSLGQGAHQITITVTDLAGNMKLGTINFVKDTILPTFSTLLPGNNSYFRAAFNFSAFVYDVNYNNMTYQVDSDNTRLCSRNTSVTIILDGWALVQGAHTLKITAVDVVGNSKIGLVYFTWDTNKPSITLVSPLTNGTYFNAGFTIVTTITDTNLHSKWYRVDSGSNTTFTGNITISFASLSQGLHNVQIYANDSARNSQWMIYQFTKDTIAPAITVLTPGQNSIFNAAFSMSTQVVDANYNNMYYRIDSFTNGTYSFNGNQTINAAAFSAIGQGSHAVHFYATDRAGNVNNVTLTFIKDTIAPVVTIPLPVNATRFKAVFSFQANVFDVNFASLTYQVNLLSVRSFSRNTSTTINVSDWISLSDGTHQIRMTATDMPGNIKVLFLAFTKDTAGPVVTFNQATNQTPCLIGLTNYVEKGDNVTLRIRVLDAYSGVSRVQVFVNITGTSVASTMTNQSGGIYQYVIMGLSYQGITVSYYFRTNDTLNNVVTSATYTYFIVYDKETPVVAVNNVVQYTSSLSAGSTQTFQATLRNYNTASAMTVIYAVQAIRPDGVVMNLVYNASVVVSAGGTRVASLSLTLPSGVTGIYTCTVQIKTGWIAAGGYTTWIKTVTFTATT